MTARGRPPTPRSQRTSKPSPPAACARKRRGGGPIGRCPACRPPSLALVALNAALIGWRAEVVRFLPQTASLYAAIGLPVNLRGLAFAERHERDRDP